MSAAEVGFWLSAVTLGYLYVGYPVLVAAWARRARREPQRDKTPRRISVVVVAHNEAACIEQRIRNLLALDYPSQCVDVVLVSDGSTDTTLERARAGAPRGLRTVAVPRRSGKPAALNRVIPQCKGDVVVLADARQRFGSDAFRALVAPFADPEVGAVSGELVLLDGTASSDRTAGAGAGFYWRYEKWIRKCESQMDSTVGVTGAIYAIRRELFREIPEDTVLDDVLIPMNVVRQGYRVVFEPAAKAYDHVSPSAGHELVRKVRTIAGNFQLFARERWLVDPRSHRLWLQTVSHKVLRLAGPWLLLATFATNVSLVAEPLYAALLAFQVAFYAAACTAPVLSWLSGGAAPRCLAAPYAVCLLNWATALAFWRFCRGGLAATWERTGGSSVMDESLACPAARQETEHQ
jgi:poly-beta-1,6-N-acetyl-D-glucosamine synthase